MINTINKAKRDQERQELYILTNELIKSYKTDDLTKNEKDNIILMVKSKAMNFVKYNCARFITTTGCNELTHGEAMDLALTFGLWYAIRDFKADLGVHFLKFWQTTTYNVLYNEMDGINTNKEKMNRRVTSADAELYNDGESSSTLYDVYADTSEEEEKWCFEMAFKNALNDFMCIDKYGKIIEYELIETTHIKTRLILNFLNEEVGSTSYGNRERSIVHRTKSRFKKFLITNNEKYGLADDYIY